MSGGNTGGTTAELVTGAQAVIKSLEALGVDVVFGYPGGAIMPAYDPLIDADLTHVLVRHEQGAVHMAEGYAQATGRVGVCIVTSGPAATNLVTGLADAHMDSIPVLAITGQVARSAIGSDAFQEADVTGITMPITKHNELVQSPERIAAAIKEAYHVARSGRPGPVLVDIPKDVLNATFAWSWPERLDLPGYRPTVRGHGKMVREALQLIAAAERPVVYAGGGLVRAGADQELYEFVTRLGLPVVTTLMARGVFPDTHELAVGMPGMHGHYAAVKAFQEADLLITLGARFDDRVTGDLGSFAPHAKVIHVDVDPAEIGKNRVVDVPVVGDVKVVLGQLLKVLDDKADDAAFTPDAAAWRTHLAGMKQDHPLRFEQPTTGVLKPQTAIRAVYETWGDEAVYVAGVGQHQMWAAQHIPYTRGRQWINSGGLGTMGFAVPAAIGAKVGVGPDTPVVAVDGDGCFQMTFQELATAVQHDIPVVFCVVNNGYLGMVRQWQHLFYDDRLSQVALPQDCPDLMKIADAYGIPGFRVQTVDELDTVLAKAREITDQPVLVEFRVDPDEMVFPMIPGGASNDDILESADEWRARLAATGQ